MTSEFGIANLTNECLEQLHLEQNPFTEHAGDTYIYSDRQTEMATNVILDNLQNSNSTIVICGDQGIGKTTYLRKLLRKGYQRYQFCTLRAKTNMSFQDICDKIAQRWIIHTSDNSNNPVTPESIEDYVVVYLGEQNHGVIIIDDADRLSLEVINELLTLKHRVGLAVPGRLGLVVTGKNSLILSLSELEGMNPAASQVYQVNIRPFNKEQTVNYVQFRLRTAGSGETLALDEDEIEGIHDASRGAVREIHRLAISALRNKCSSLGTDVFSEPETNNSDETTPFLKPVLLFGLPILIAASIFWMTNRDNSDVEDKIPLTLPEQIVETEVPDTPVQREDITLPVTADTIEDNEPVEAVSAEVTIVEPPAEAAAQEPISLDREMAETNDAQLNSPIETSVSTNTANQTDLAAASESENTHSSGRVEDATSTIPVDTSPEIVPPAPVESQVTIPNQGIAWLKQLNTEHYSLQILASSDQKPLLDLVKKHALKEHFAIYPKTVNGKKWYVLVTGDYPTKNAASSAIKDLPSDFQKAKPWPVSIGLVLKQL